MNQETLPVTVAVTQADGRVERILVGEAHQGPNGLEMRLHSLAVGIAPTAAAAMTLPVPMLNPATANRPSLRSAAGVAHTIDDLQRMADRARKALADPRKERWHADERTLLTEIEAELARKKEGVPLRLTEAVAR